MELLAIARHFVRHDCGWLLLVSRTIATTTVHGSSELRTSFVLAVIQF